MKGFGSLRPTCCQQCQRNPLDDLDTDIFRVPCIGGRILPATLFRRPGLLGSRRMKEYEYWGKAECLQPGKADQWYE